MKKRWIFLILLIVQSVYAITSISPDDNQTYSTGTNVNFSCNTTDAAGINNLSLWTDYTGSWLPTSTYSRGDFNENGTGNLLNLTRNSPTSLTYTTVRTSHVDVGTSYANKTIDGNFSSAYQMVQPNYTAGSQWIEYELNDVYSISNIYQNRHSSENFRCAHYAVQIGVTNTTFYTAFNASNSSYNVTQHLNDTFEAVNGKYVRLTCYLAGNLTQFYYPIWYEIIVSGQILQNATQANKTFNLTTNNYGNFTWGCGYFNISGSSAYSTNRTLNIYATTSLSKAYNYPTSGNSTYFTRYYCKAFNTQYNESNLTYTAQYKKSNDTAWTNLTSGEFISKYLIYSIGDSITASNVYPNAFDNLSGANSSALNASNTSQRLYNLGISGESCEGLRARYNTSIPSNTTVFLMCGINDLASGVNSTVIKFRMEQIANYSRTKNNTIYWMNIAPHDTINSTVCSYFLDVNAWILNLSANYTNIIPVDVYSALNNGTDCRYIQDYDSGDNVHPSVAGYRIIGEALWNSTNRTQMNSTVYKVNLSTVNDSYYDFRCSAMGGGLESDWYYNYTSVFVNGSGETNTTNTTEESTDSSSSSSTDPFRPVSSGTVLKGESGEFKFYGYTSLRLVKFEAINEIRNKVMYIEYLDNDNDKKELPELLSLPVYHYEKIIHAGIEEEDLKNITIQFRVLKSWCESNVVKEDIVLKRYESKWTDLSTTQIDEDSLYYYFESQSPGLSYFAISKKEETQKTEATEEKNNLILNDEKSKNIYYILAIILITFIIIISIFIRKKSERERRLYKKSKKKIN